MVVYVDFPRTEKKDKLGNNPNILAFSFSFIRTQDGGRGCL